MRLRRSCAETRLTSTHLYTLFDFILLEDIHCEIGDSIIDPDTIQDYLDKGNPRTFHSFITIIPSKHIDHDNNSSTHNTIHSLYQLIQMPLLVHRRTSHSHANLPITFSTALSLTAALVYLQLLYAASHLLRPFSNSRREFTSLRGAIDQTERRTIDIILRIVPSSAYRSPPTSGLLHEDPLGHRINGAARAGLENGARSQLPSPSSVVPVTDPPQGYPGCLWGCTPPRSDGYRLDSVNPAQLDRQGGVRSGSSVPETAKKHSSSGRPRVSPRASTVMETHQFTTQQDPSTSHPQRQHPEHTSYPEHTKSQSAGPVPDTPQPQPQACSKSPVVSLDGAREPSIKFIATDSDDSADSETLQLSRQVKRRSTESYPGKYPVSDGLEYSKLATASHAFRERGTTSVRPFSDY